MMKKTLVIVLACVALNFAMVTVGWTAETISSEKLICTVDFSSWVAESLTVRPDNMHVAYVARKGNTQVVVIDGKEGKRYDSIITPGPIFSPDSKRVAYAARTGSKVFAVIDGKEENQSYDGTASLVFSPDSKQVGYMAKTGTKWLVVIDGKEGKRYDTIVKGSNIKFNPDGSFYYLARKGNGIYLVTSQGLTKTDSE